MSHFILSFRISFALHILNQSNLFYIVNNMAFYSTNSSCASSFGFAFTLIQLPT